MIPRQDSFNTMVEHLDKQAAEFGTMKYCNYRCYLTNKAGQLAPYRCPVGALLPDDVYCRRLEGTFRCGSCFTDESRLLQAHIAGLGHDVVLCKTMQQVHDDYYPCDWHRELCAVARHFQLQMPDCPNLLALGATCSSTTTA